MAEIRWIRPLTIALLAAAVTAPASAQRGSSRGSGGFAHGGVFSTRSAPAYRGSLAPTGRAAYPTGVRPGIALARPSFYYNPRSSRPVQIRRGPGYRAAYGYPYGYAGWIGPDYLNFPYESADDISYAPPVDAQDDLAETYIAPPEPQPGADFQPQPAYAAPAPLTPEDAVTLVFKDGRPPQQIHNYMLTRTTLTVTDGHRFRDVAVADLDLAATEKANRDAGIHFELPQIAP